MGTVNVKPILKNTDENQLEKEDVLPPLLNTFMPSIVTMGTKMKSTETEEMVNILTS